MHRQPQSLGEMRTVMQMLSLEGKTALVTGAAGGIGKATSGAFAQLGAKVALVDIPSKENALHSIANTLSSRWGVECRCYLADISKEEAVENLFHEVEKEIGTVTILHNNAGIGIWPDNAALPTDAWQKMLNVNLSGSFFVARTCAKHIRDKGLTGSIVSTASMSAHIINAGPGYSATKAGVKHMSASLAIEYAPYGIRFNTVSYGYILSGMHKADNEVALENLYNSFDIHTPMKRMGALDEVIGAVVFAASDLSSFMTGADILVDGGFSIGRLF